MLPDLETLVLDNNLITTIHGSPRTSCHKLHTLSLNFNTIIDLKNTVRLAQREHRMHTEIRRWAYGVAHWHV